MKYQSALVSLGVLAISACSGRATNESGPSGSVRSTSSALEQAPADTKDTFAVGLCIGPLSEGDAGPVGTCKQGVSSACSGTLVAPNLVLTARHCVEFPTVNAPNALCLDHVSNLFEAANLVDATTVRVTVAPSVRLGSPVWHAVSSIVLPSTTAACDDDLALLQLSDTIAASDAVPADADIFTDLAVDKPSAVTIVGRGAIAESYDPDSGARLTYDRGDFTRRILTNLPVSCVSDTDATCHLLDYTIQLPPNGFDLGKGVFVVAGNTGHGGDSGASVLDQKRYDGGKPTVIGVFSYEGIDATGSSSESFAVRLTQHKDLITQTAKAAALAGGYPVPAWVTAAPVLGGDAGASDAGATSDGGVGGQDSSIAEDGGVGADDGGRGASDGSGSCSLSRGARSSDSLAYLGGFAALGLVAARRRRR